MPTPQKSEVRPEAPKQKQPEMFCRDCEHYSDRCKFCFVFRVEVHGDDCRNCQFWEAA